MMDKEICDFIRNLTADLDAALAELAEKQRGWLRYEKLRKLKPRQYAELHKRNLKREASFDDLVDQLPEP